MIGAVFRKRVRFVTLSDLFGNYRMLDLALDTFETIKVRRDSVPLGAVREALEHLEQGGVLAIFPEGTRASSFGEIPLAAGAAWLAVRTKVPLVPIAIMGADRVLGIDNRLRRGRIKVAVGPALQPDGVGRAAVDDLTGRWAAWIEKTLTSPS